MFKNLTLGARIWIVVAMCLGVGASAIVFLTTELKSTSNSYEETMKGLQESSRHMNDARVIQVTFKKLVQEWKDTLLRGYNPADLAKYSGQFHAEADKVTSLGAALQSAMPESPERRPLRIDLAELLLRRPRPRLGACR